MTLWQTTPRSRDTPRELYLVIETPRGSRNKYEVAKHFPGIMLDRILSLTRPTIASCRSIGARMGARWIGL